MSAKHKRRSKRTYKGIYKKEEHEPSYSHSLPHTRLWKTLHSLIKHTVYQMPTIYIVVAQLEFTLEL